MSTKIQTIFTCAKCDTQFPAWQGRCNECGNWGTISPASVARERTGRTGADGANISDNVVMSLAAIAPDEKLRISTHITELDMVLGGGIVQGSLILLGGDPGIGKSTLALQILHSLQDRSNSPLYVSAEESATQVKLRAERLDLAQSNIQISTENELETIIAIIEKWKPALVVIDSIQTIASNEVAAEPGNISQVKVCTTKLLGLAKKQNIPIIITGHVTKEGFVAGPKFLEHIVDVVLYLEGEKETHFRILRSNKNRFGSTNEIAIFEMSGTGLIPVKNPSSYFLEHGDASVPGTTRSCIVQGNKVFFLEIQALVTKTHFGNAVRKTTGFDLNRLSLLSAVISNRLRVPLENYDIYLNIVGGLKTKETALDLAVVYALLSAYHDVQKLPSALLFGEVGLGGEVRGVSHAEKRIKEAEKLGFQEILMPRISKKPAWKHTVTLREIRHIHEMVALMKQ